MLASKGILTTRGGRTSHAALVARQFGKPAVVGVSSLTVDLGRRRMSVKDKTVHEGDWISIDGTTGEVYLDKLATTIPDIKDPWLIKLLSWADGFRRLGVWANADYPRDAKRARDYGAEGIGLWPRPLGAVPAIERKVSLQVQDGVLVLLDHLDLDPKFHDRPGTSHFMVDPLGERRMHALKKPRELLDRADAEEEMEVIIHENVVY